MTLYQRSLIVWVWKVNDEIYVHRPEETIIVQVSSEEWWVLSLYLNKDAHLEFSDTDFISSYKQAGLDEKRATLVLTLLIEKGVFFIRKEINDQLKCLSRFFENPSVIIRTDQDTVEAYAEAEECKIIGVGSDFEDDYTYNRSSTRRFSGEKLPIDELSAILETTYFKSNLGHRPVPSGGAFYPLQFFYLQNKKECLLYHFPSSTPFLTSKVGLNITDYFLSDDQIDWEQSDGLLFIFADLQSSSKKYGYKSLRLAYLEAGHCAQNIYLMAEKDKKLGVCEIVWIWEDRITHDFWVENLIFMTAFVVWKKF